MPQVYVVSPTEFDSEAIDKLVQDFVLSSFNAHVIYASYAKLATAAAFSGTYGCNKLCCNPHAKNYDNDDSDFLISNYTHSGFDFGR